MAARKALFVSPESPYPTIGGGPLRSASLLEFLSARFQTDVFVSRQPGDPDPLPHFPLARLGDVYTCTLPAHSKNTVARAWRTIDRLRRSVPPLLDRFQFMSRELATWLAGRQYDLIVVEHFWCAPFAAHLRPHTRRLVLDLHNFESRWHARCAQAERAPVRWAHERFSAQYERLEKEWLPKFDDIMTTSELDAAAARATHGSACVHVYPNALPFHPATRQTREPVLAFSGNFEYLPNIQAVRYFRHEIWPVVRDQYPDLRWRLIGRCPEAVARWTGDDPRIEVTGPVLDAVAEIGRTAAAVVPLLSGSGTRLKILEAWSAETPVISTSLGAEGLLGQPGQHWLRADNPNEFFSALALLLSSDQLAARIGQAGRALFENQYTWEAAWRALKWLEEEW